jgi:hypothetical protein
MVHRRIPKAVAARIVELSAPGSEVLMDIPDARSLRLSVGAAER